MQRALIVIGKAPVPGKAKTRLVPALTHADAAALSRAFLLDTLELAQQANWEQITLIHPRGDAPHLHHLAPWVNLLEQPDHGLGNALSYAFSHHFERGFDKVVLIGSDNPTLPLQPILSAEAALQGADDLAIGPTHDGGYYLIGMRQPHLGIFDDIPWSSPEVYQRTLQHAERLRLRMHSVQPWYDVDEPRDLDRLRAELSVLSDAVAAHTRRALHGLSPALAAAAEAVVPSAPRSGR